MKGAKEMRKKELWGQGKTQYLKKLKGASEMRQLLFYLFLGLAAGLLFFFFTQRLATNLKTSLQALQEQRLTDQMDYCEQPEAYQPTREQLHLIESYSDIITETEADYIEIMGHFSPRVRDQFPNLPNAVEVWELSHAQITDEIRDILDGLWDIIYNQELDHFHKHGQLSQRILDQIKESEEQAEAIQRIFGDKEQRR